MEESREFGNSFFGEGSDFEVGSFEDILEVPTTEQSEETPVEVKEEPVIPEVENSESVSEFTDPEEVTEDESPSLDTFFTGEEIDPITEEETSESFSYNDVARQLIESGVWENFETLETEDGEVSLDEVALDAETFMDLQKQQIALKVERETNQLSDFTQQLIRIEKNGGDVQTALNSYQKYKHPLESLDMENVEDQRAAIFLAQSAKLPKEEVLANIRDYEKAGTLADRAVESKRNLEQAFAKQMELLEQQGIERKEKEVQLLKEYKKGIGTNLEADFELTPTYRKKLVQAATQADEQGTYELDRVYREFRKDPKKAAALALFLLDPEEYQNQITGKAQATLKRKEFVKMRLTPKTTRKRKSNTTHGGSGVSIKDLL
jgi:hypothetical protein